MLLVIPFIYFFSFIISIYFLFKGKPDSIFIFIIFGLSIYNTALSITCDYQYEFIIPFLQLLKEIFVLITLAYFLWHHKTSFNLQTIDYLILVFLLYTTFYLFLPIGKYNFLQRLVALKSLSFFPMLYFVGRFFWVEKFNFEKILIWVGSLMIIASLVLFLEILNDTHFQTITGYSYFNEKYFGLEQSGRYGLTWSFEYSDGVKRFASLFSNPLEYAGASLLTLSIFIANYTDLNNKFKLNNFSVIIFFVTILGIIFSFSRSSFVSYFILIYFYSLISSRKLLTYTFYAFILITIIIIYFFVEDRYLLDYIISTLQLNDSSSIGHLLEWEQGIENLISSPLGLGLGESGRVSSEFQGNIGGENQFIIVGVQTGLISLLIYLSIYTKIILLSWRAVRTMNSSIKKLSLSVVLMKISFLFPTFTSNFDSYSFITYFIWIFTGIFVTYMERYSLNKENESIYNRN